MPACGRLGLLLLLASLQAREFEAFLNQGEHAKKKKQTKAEQQAEEAEAKAAKAKAGTPGGVFGGGSAKVLPVDAEAMQAAQAARTLKGAQLTKAKEQARRKYLLEDEASLQRDADLAAASRAMRHGAQQLLFSRIEQRTSRSYLADQREAAWIAQGAQLSPSKPTPAAIAALQANGGGGGGQAGGGGSPTGLQGTNHLHNTPMFTARALDRVEFPSALRRSFS